ncbi:MAG: LPS-assembly protein, partial [Hyphomonadaceae bacterium]
IGNGLVVAPLVSVRSDAYSYTNQRLAAGVAIGSRQLTRTLGTVSLDLKWPLVRQMDNLNLMIIPRVNLAASSKADLSNQISIEDSNGYDNNFSSYFNQTPSSNYDIWDSGNRATIGVNVIANSGNSSFDWFVGKQYRDNSNPFLDRLTNLDREDGDWVSNLTINVNANLSFDGNIRMDAITGELVRAELAARLSYAGAGLSFRYHEMPLRIGGTERANRELVTRASYRFGEKTRIFADNWYDFRTNSNLRSRIGGGFGDDCTEVLVYYEETNTTNRFITPSSGFKIQIAFKTIGLINEEPFE